MASVVNLQAQPEGSPRQVWEAPPIDKVTYERDARPVNPLPAFSQYSLDVFFEHFLSARLLYLLVVGRIPNPSADYGSFPSFIPSY
jgi:hypothetical protein